jgi:hypothetical protein
MYRKRVLAGRVLRRFHSRFEPMKTRPGFVPAITQDEIETVQTNIRAFREANANLLRALRDTCEEN